MGQTQHAPRRRGAVLIDADNLPHRHVTRILDIARRYCDASVRRVYANFAASTVSGWTHAAARNGLSCEHVTYNVPGKNSADIALVIDAIDLAHEGIEVFVIASSDSDFSRLATRLRERGCEVIVCGRAVSPGSLRNAATTFVDLDSPAEVERVTAPDLTRARPRQGDHTLAHAIMAKAVRTMVRTGVAKRILAKASRPNDARPTKTAAPTPQATYGRRLEDVTRFLEDAVRAAGGRINDAKLADALYDHYDPNIVHALGKARFKDLVDGSDHLDMQRHVVTYHQ